MLDTIFLSALIVLLAINFILDYKSSKKTKTIHNDVLKQRLDKISKKVSAINIRTVGCGPALEEDLQLTMKQLESVQEKIAELEVSIQNLSNKK